MTRRSLLSILVLAWATPSAWADRTLTYRLEIAGTAVGESRTTVGADGSFTGSSTLKIGREIATTFSGRTKGAVIPEYTIAIDAAGQAVTIRGEDGEATVQVRGQTTAQPLGAVGRIPEKFAAFSPYFMRTLWPRIQAGSGVFEVQLLDGTSKAPATVVGTSKRETGGKSVTLATMKVAAIELQVAFDGEGECVGFDVPAQRFRAIAAGFERAFVSPIDAYPELSAATFAPERRTVEMPMRDGKRLAAEIFRPKTEARVPTILIRTPYGRAAEALANGWYAARGYAVVVQDCRGRGGSEGEWDPFVNEGRDGKDTIDWIAAQPWSNGKVGMIGGSYDGFVQWAAAVEHPKALACLVPQVSPPGSAMRNLPYVYGVPLLLTSLWWLRIVEGKDADLSLYAQGFPGAAALTTLPLTRLDEAVLGRNLPIWDTWLRRDSAAKWPGWNFQSKLAGVAIPTLSISGYFDGDEIGTMLNWDTRRGAGWTNGWLIYGPWPHGFNASTAYGGIDFGKDSTLELDSVYLRFFDTYLKGKTVGWNSRPKVSAFLTGANRWVSGSDWPLPESEERNLYLAGTGQSGGGRLLEGPRKADPPTRTVYDPAKARVPKALIAPRLDPEGTLIGRLKTIERGAAIFRSAPMRRATRVAGPILLDIMIATSARSTDLFATVVDEAPDGTFRQIGQPGVARLGSKDNGDVPGTVRPNVPTALRVRLWDFAHEFAPGHRLALILTHDGFPAYARNLGNGDPIATGTRMVVQRNTIYHDAKRPSRLRFRVLP